VVVSVLWLSCGAHSHRVSIHAHRGWGFFFCHACRPLTGRHLFTTTQQDVEFGRFQLEATHNSLIGTGSGNRRSSRPFTPHSRGRRNSNASVASQRRGSIARSRRRSSTVAADVQALAANALSSGGTAAHSASREHMPNSRQLQRGMGRRSESAAGFGTPHGHRRQGQHYHQGRTRQRPQSAVAATKRASWRVSAPARRSSNVGFTEKFRAAVAGRIG